MSAWTAQTLTKAKLRKFLHFRLLCISRTDVRIQVTRSRPMVVEL